MDPLADPATWFARLEKCLQNEFMRFVKSVRSAKEKNASYLCLTSSVLECGPLGVWHKPVARMMKVPPSQWESHGTFQRLEPFIRLSRGERVIEIEDALRVERERPHHPDWTNEKEVLLHQTGVKRRPSLFCGRGTEFFNGSGCYYLPLIYRAC